MTQNQISRALIRVHLKIVYEIHKSFTRQTQSILKSKTFSWSHQYLCYFFCLSAYSGTL